MILTFAVVLSACSSKLNSADGRAADAAAVADAVAEAIAADATPSDANPNAVTFRYTPDWSGVVSVDVIGAFGQATDWTAPLVSLTENGGTFTGTAVLPPGTYDYLFHVVGDADAGTHAATFSRYAFDPSASAYVPCPAQSPQYSATDTNPCVSLAVPVTTPPPAQFHVRGTVVIDGAPVAGYLVELEREELMSHHLLVNRATTGADGSYDIVAAPGRYRIEVLHPQFESKTDQQLVPTTLNIARRNLSSPFEVAADVTVSAAEMAFHDYASFAPITTGTTLPTTFSFGNSAALSTKLTVYGTGNAGANTEIGDPWFTSPATATGSAVFSGTFPVGFATETAVATGERYFWGVEQAYPADSAGVVWTNQSLVDPVTWH